MTAENQAAMQLVCEREVSFVYFIGFQGCMVELTIFFWNKQVSRKRVAKKKEVASFKSLVAHFDEYEWLKFDILSNAASFFFT